MILRKHSLKEYVCTFHEFEVLQGKSQSFNMINGLIWGQPAGMKNFVLEHIHDSIQSWSYNVKQPWGLTMHDIMNQSSHDHKMSNSLEAWPSMISGTNQVMNQSSHDHNMWNNPWGLTMHDIMNQSSHDHFIYNIALRLDHAWYHEPIQSWSDYILRLDHAWYHESIQSWPDYIWHSPEAWPCMMSWTNPVMIRLYSHRSLD